MSNPHCVPDAVRSRLTAIAVSLATEYWPQTQTGTFIGTDWELHELRCYQPDGRIFGATAERVHDSEVGMDATFTELWDDAEVALQQIPEATWATLQTPEPWLAVTGFPDHPTLAWRVTTATPFDYESYREMPAD